jgi:hypothetical protein
MGEDRFASWHRLFPSPKLLFNIGQCSRDAVPRAPDDPDADSRTTVTDFCLSTIELAK